MLVFPMVRVTGSPTRRYRGRPSWARPVPTPRASDVPTTTSNEASLLMSFSFRRFVRGAFTTTLSVGRYPMCVENLHGERDMSGVQVGPRSRLWTPLRWLGAR
jgi:hypothetical protein